MKKLSLTEIVKAFETRGYKVLDNDYLNADTKIRFECSKHKGLPNAIKFRDLRRGGCKYCGLKRPTIEEVNTLFEERGYTLLSEKYVDYKTKLSYKCSKHPDKTNFIIYGNFRSGQGCPYCFGKSKYTLDQVKSFFDKAGYELLDEIYVNNKAPLKYRCPKHPNEKTLISVKSLLKGTRCRFCYLDKNKGITHSNYNPNLSNDERESKRFYFDYYEWRRKVFERDSYTCVVCNDKTGGNLIAHHKDGYGWCKERRTDVSNGVTLCSSCHKDFHSKYGVKKNTEDQYFTWVKEKEEIL